MEPVAYLLIINTGTLSKKIVNNENTTIYEYDQWGLRSKNSGTRSITTEYKHDAHGRLVREAKLSGEINTFQYDLLDKLIFENRNGKITRYWYDNTGTLIKKKLEDGNLITYLRDKRGRRLISKSSTGWYQKYSYDRNGNNISKQLNNGVIRHFQYGLKDNELFPPLSVNHEGNPYQQGR